MSTTSKAPIQPLGDYVLLEQEAAESKTTSGLYIPGNAQEKPKVAKVLAVGPGKVGDDNERVAVSVKVGDHVVFGGYSNTAVKMGGIEYLLVREEYIYGIIK